jgi:ArsR family transcriptional regulator
MRTTGPHLYYQMHSELCQVFTSPKRLEIIDLLRESERSVQQLTELTGIPQANLSQHLAILRQQKMVKTRRDGTCIYYSIADRRLIKALDLVKEMLVDRIKAEGKMAEKLSEGMNR